MLGGITMEDVGEVCGGERNEKKKNGMLASSRDLTE